MTENCDIERLNSIVYENTTDCITNSVTKLNKIVVFSSNKGHVVFVNEKGYLLNLLKSNVPLSCVCFYKNILIVAGKQMSILMDKNYETKPYFINDNHENINKVCVFKTMIFLIRTKSVVILNRKRNIKYTVKHEKKINDLRTYDNFFITCSNDKSIKIWNYDGSLKQKIFLHDAVISSNVIEGKIHCRTTKQLLEILINF